ncbi:hypothetical protein [Tuanshanicoccus lijuaniae]|uniref:hypothetical protein n=1 Tax=Aerococcaceae bacterium zg-1292 TaxID=2774330 RepID=UPI001BD8D5C3|nr:hypothetical protein [Aerococcaceae bacterium zg-BR9]MBF6978880.1 hypothetical protein [Aerococcaceae bacterium zg-BR22]MBS4455314.1 hypothetical protein [Aerococcaceae bacterium zg-A91]MBS4457876.1 hypothetical protein [Aerococcaceae bacterium zg-BR33]
MKNKRGMALPIVMVFLFLSQLLYMSLLSYNQIQSQRYKNFSAYYENQIQFALAKQMLASDNVKTQLENELLSVIEKQSNYFSRLLPVEKILYQSNQLKLYQTANEALVLIAHHLYIDEQFPESLLPLNNFILDGILLQDAKKQPIDGALLKEVNQLVATLKEENWQENSNRKKQRNFQYRIQEEKLPIHTFHFENGTVIVQERLNEWRLNSTLTHSHLTAGETLPKQTVYYLVESYALYFEQNN